MTGAEAAEAERALVTAQIGREPRDPWRIEVRCRFGRPQVITSPPVLADGTPFPTLYWLTCPYLLRKVAAEESSGGAADVAGRLATDDSLADALRDADEEYRRRRRAEGGGEDPCSGVGIAGQREPLGTKCLHAHVAARLAGIADPVGEASLRRTGTSCPDDECSRLMREAEETR